jgi:alpha-glucosidase
MKFIKIFILSLLSSYATGIQAQQKHVLYSPDRKIEVTLSVSDSVYYTVKVDQKEFISASAISLDVDGKNKWKVAKTSRVKHNDVLHPVVWQKSKEVADVYNQLRLDFNNGLALEWKAFDNGVSWRWLSKLKGDFLVRSETAKFNFKGSGKAWYPLEEQFFSHNEREYKKIIPWIN